MPGAILYGFTDDEIKTFPCVILKMTAEETADVTEKPVETGLTITDHVKLNPARVSVLIQVSPLAISEEKASNVDAATALLQRIRRARTVCTVSGDLGQFEEMILTSWSMERSAEQGKGAEVSLDFKQLTYAESITSAVLPRRPRDRRQVNRGAQSTAPNPRRSLAAALFEDMAGMGLIHSTTPAR